MLCGYFRQKNWSTDNSNHNVLLNLAIALENIDRRAYELNITFSILMSVLKKYKIHDVIMPVQLVHDDYAVYDDDIIFTRDGKNPIFFWAGLGFWVL